jgi:Ner family transcriptional regulator
MSIVNRKLNMAKNTPPLDWDSADLKWALAKAGTSMSKLSREHNYNPGSVRMVMNVPWPKMERIVAAALGVLPQTIWPSRYRPDGSPKSGRGERGLGRYKPASVVYSVANKSKHNKTAEGCNVKEQSADEHRKAARRTVQDRRAA